MSEPERIHRTDLDHELAKLVKLFIETQPHDVCSIKCVLDERPIFVQRAHKLLILETGPDLQRIELIRCSEIELFVLSETE